MTQRVCFDNNLEGIRIRLHLSSRYAKVPLILDRISIGRCQGQEVADATHVTKDGREQIIIGPGEEFFSDEIPFITHAGDRLAVSIYVKEAQSIESICCFWDQTGTSVSFHQRDATSGTILPPASLEDLIPFIRDDPNPRPTILFFGFDALQIETRNDVKVIAAFGDSITHMSFVTNALSRRLYRTYPGQVALLNCGIGGNRLVHDATFVPSIGAVIPVFGEAGVKRFSQNVFGLDQVDSVLSLIGINDIMHPLQLEEKTQTSSPEAILDGYAQIAEIAHRHGAKIFAGTIMPCGNDIYPTTWLPIFEEAR